MGGADAAGTAASATSGAAVGALVYVRTLTRIRGAAGCVPASRAGCAGAVAWHKGVAEATRVRPRNLLGKWNS